MDTPDSRKEALTILRRWFTGDDYIDHLLNNNRDSLSPQSRRFRDALIHLTLQWQRQLDAVVTQFFVSGKKPPLQTHILLLMGAAELLHMDGTRDHGTVHSLVSLAGYHKKFVNAILRQIIRYRDSGGFERFLKDPAVPPGIRHSFPDWLVERWHRQFGDELESLLIHLNRPPLRMVRLMDVSKGEQVIQTLKAMDLWISVHPKREDFYLVHSVQPVLDHTLFRDGIITIQDVSSTLPEYFFPEGGIRLACDVCSAPGGKTAALLKNTRPGGQVYAYDSDGRRLSQVKETLERLNLTAFTLTEADARTFTYPPAELFLVDTPCSGFGVIRKRSDLRWRRKPEDLETLHALQLEILENVSRSVPEGGHIIYSTCTFDEEENTGVLKTFLQNHPDFSWGDPPDNAPESWKDPDFPVLRTYPHRHDCEGSFAGRIKRT